jgi:hypothetical protein
MCNNEDTLQKVYDIREQAKFRGKRIDGGGWVYGYYYQDFFSRKHFIHTIDGDDPEGNHIFAVRPDTIGKYIGQKDNSGVAAYTGDIVRESYFKTVGVLRYEANESRFMVKCLDGGYQDLAEVEFSSYSSEIIGNEIDDPELIKEVATV